MSRNLPRSIALLLLMSTFSLISLAQNSLNLNYLSTYQTGVFDGSAAEIAAFDVTSARVFFTNANANSVTILDISNPVMPSKVMDIDMSTYGGGVNSVAIYNGLVAVAVQANDKTMPGSVVFFNTDGTFQAEVVVGALPDMLTFNQDGTKVLVANEGEPNDLYDVDPEGSVSIIDLSNGVANATITNVTFESFNDKKVSLQNRGIRIYGPNATVAQDLEPEYITVTPDNATAYVSLQENNALAVIDLTNNTLRDILPLGYKDHLRGAPILTEYKINELIDLPSLGTPVYAGNRGPVILGGFSGLYFDANESDADNYVFYTIPDRGPNDAQVSPNSLDQDGIEQDLRPFLLPEYQGRIVKFTLNITTGAMTLDDQVLLTRQDGTTPISGKGNIIGFDEVPVAYTQAGTPYNSADLTSPTDTFHILNHDPFGGDFEGIVRDNDGNFWMCDEYRPAIYKFGTDGILIERYVAAETSFLGFAPLEPGFYGAETLPKIYNKRRANRGFEAIAYDSDANIIYAFIQSPIENPGSSVRNQSDVIRILGIDATDGTPVAEYVYLLERNRDAGLGTRVDKIGDAVYTGNGKFLVIERDSSVPGEDTGKKYIFEINLAGATNILNNPIALRDSVSTTGFKTLEQMTADELAAEGIQAVHKTKMLNLPSIGYLPSDKAEGLALLPGGSLAVLNDNDFGLAGAGITDDSVLGIIDFSQNYGFDPSDRDNGINIAPQPVLGTFHPDAITSYTINGKTYVLTANEGDARVYPMSDLEGGPNEGDIFNEEDRMDDFVLDEIAFPNASVLQQNENLGRLNGLTKDGDLDGDGDYDILYAFGARSFSIWDALGNLVFDSGDDFEQITAAEYPNDFNSNNDENDSFESRSDNKGPEPEAVIVAELDGVPYAFIGLERIGGIMVYDISDPAAPEFVLYINNRDFSVMNVETSEVGDLGPEDIKFISAADSPNGDALLIVSNEVSGSVSIFTFGDVPTDVDDIAANTSNWRVYPNPVQDVIFTNINADFAIYNSVGQQLMRVKNSNYVNVSRLPAGTFVIRNLQNGQSQLFMKR